MFPEVETMVLILFWVNRNNSQFDILDYQPKNEIDNLSQLLDIV